MFIYTKAYQTGTNPMHDTAKQLAILCTWLLPYLYLYSLSGSHPVVQGQMCICIDITYLYNKGSINFSSLH